MAATAVHPEHAKAVTAWQSDDHEEGKESEGKLSSSSGGQLAHDGLDVRAAELPDAQPGPRPHSHTPSEPSIRKAKGTALPLSPSRKGSRKVGRLASFVSRFAGRASSETMKVDAATEHGTWSTRILAPHIKWDAHKKQNIVRYDSNGLFTWAYLQMWVGTVVDRRLLIQICLFCGIATFFGYFKCDPSRMGDGSEEFKNRGWTICIPLGNTQALTLVSFAGFLLSLFANLVFSRWWQTRGLLQRVMGNAQKLALTVTAMTDWTDDIGRRLSSDLVRYLHLGVALMHKHATLVGPGAGHSITDDEIEKLYADVIEDRLMTTEEWAALKPVHNKWQICFGWTMRLLREIQVRNLFPAAGPNVLAVTTTTAQEVHYSATELFMVLTTPIPYPYAHLLAVITKFHLIFMCLYASSVIGEGFVNLQAERLVLGYLIIAFNSLIFEGILLLHVLLENPFGDDACDFPMMNYRRSAIADTSDITRLLRADAPEAVSYFDKNPFKGAVGPAPAAVLPPSAPASRSALGAGVEGPDPPGLIALARRIQ